MSSFDRAAVGVKANLALRSASGARTDRGCAFFQPSEWAEASTGYTRRRRCWLVMRGLSRRRRRRFARLL